MGKIANIPEDHENFIFSAEIYSSPQTKVVKFSCQSHHR